MPYLVSRQPVNNQVSCFEMLIHAQCLEDKYVDADSSTVLSYSMTAAINMCVFFYEVQLQTPDLPQVSIIPGRSLPSVFENKVKPPIASILPAALIEPHYVYIVQISMHSM